jgi:hypothetical protein
MIAGMGQKEAKPAEGKVHSRAKDRSMRFIKFSLFGYSDTLAT